MTAKEILSQAVGQELPVLAGEPNSLPAIVNESTASAQGNRQGNVSRPLQVAVVSSRRAFVIQDQDVDVSYVPDVDVVSDLLATALITGIDPGGNHGRIRDYPEDSRRREK